MEVTNMHTHGLHVHGRAPGDSIQTKLTPGQKYHYAFEIDESHMGGTHWFHPHHHGSTSIQAGAGAAGLIIVSDPYDALPIEVESYMEYALVALNLEPSWLNAIAQDYIEACAKVGGDPLAAQCKDYSLFDNVTCNGPKCAETNRFSSGGIILV